ncbi:class I SAM-dependent methyltransferase [Streptomyces microflavus]|uniref:class I SAM-dependent methyltransferase n=1 Tax=Streptomyces microflavus TaxID=1919 RepID=UPI00365411FE
MTKYILDNADPNAEERMAGLEQCYDPFTIQQLNQLGIQPGWSCLEVGGGGGSIGRWLADQVTPTGNVVVTDIDNRWTADPDSPQLHIEQHDITSDEPVPGAPFDLIHARLVLIHLPARRQVVHRLAALLRPGGWLVLDEFDCTRAHVFDAPATDQADLFLVWIRAFLDYLEQAGVSMTWARDTFQALREEGLTAVSATGYETASPGGSPGSRVHRSNAIQLRRPLVASGRISDTEYDRLLDLLSDPAFVPSSYLLISTRGQKPSK